MSCPTCDHTMQNLCGPGRQLFWCPRCGTLKEILGGGIESIEMPHDLNYIADASRLESLGPSVGTWVHCNYEVKITKGQPTMVRLNSVQQRR